MKLDLRISLGRAINVDVRFETRSVDRINKVGQIDIVISQRIISCWPRLILMACSNVGRFMKPVGATAAGFSPRYAKARASKWNEFPRRSACAATVTFVTFRVENEATKR